MDAWMDGWGGRRFCAETWDISFIYFVRISDPARQIWEKFLRILSPVLVRMVYNHSALYVSIWAHGVHRIK